MNKIIAIILTACLTFVLASCSQEDSTPQIPAKDEATQNQLTETAPNVNSTVIYAVFSPNEEGVDKYPLDYTGDLTVDMIADALTSLTGLNFSINSATIENGVATIDWSTESYLIAGLGDEPQNENFFFYDNVSLNWFMMNSLYLSVFNNLSVTKVFYTMDGGKQLVPTEMGTTFPLGQEIVLSGDNDSAGLSNSDEAINKLLYNTAGIWHVGGDESAANIHLNGMGIYTAYTEDGAVESSGVLYPVDDLGDGNYSFNLYNDDDQYFATMYFVDENNFYTDGPYGQNYIKTHEYQVN